MPSPTQITPTQLSRLIGTPTAPIIVDVCIDEDFAADPRLIPTAFQDILVVMELLQEIKPHQIFAAGDLRDPHGTHKVCLDAIIGAIKRLKDEDWMKDCYVWLYRGAWQEWDVEEIEMAIPISPEELLRKRKAIFKHQSQKDTPVFPGNDKREFWQRAEDRNKATAEIYDELGLTEYEAMEAFVRYKF
jgi:glucosamine-6-phosphate deaminase